MTEVVETDHAGSLRDIVVATGKQFCASLQTNLADIFLGRHTGKGFHLPVEGGMTHCHLVCHKGHVKVLCVDMLLDDTVHLLDKHTVKTTQMRFIIRHIRL